MNRKYDRNLIVRVCVVSNLLWMLSSIGTALANDERSIQGFATFPFLIFFGIGLFCAVIALTHDFNKE